MPVLYHTMPHVHHETRSPKKFPILKDFLHHKWILGKYKNFLISLMMIVVTTTFLSQL